MSESQKHIFTCVVEPRSGKASFTMRRKVASEAEALTLAVKFKQLSGGFNNYSNFRYEGRLLDTNGWIHLKTGEIIRQ